MANAEPAAKRRRLTYQEPITVVVGKNIDGIATTLAVHRDAITQPSGFFNQVCLGKLKDARNKVIRFPEIGAVTFKTYIHWLYYDEFTAAGGVGMTRSRHVEALVELYAAGVILGDVKLRNATVDAIINICTTSASFPNYDSVTSAYENTPASSPLRLLFIDYYLHALCPAYMETHGHKLPFQFLLDVVRHRMDNKNGKTAKPNATTAYRYQEPVQNMPQSGPKSE